MARKTKIETEKNTVKTAGAAKAPGVEASARPAKPVTAAELQPNQPASDETHARHAPTHEQISRRAHELWVKRGGVGGSAQDDWFRAEQELATPLRR